MTAPDLLPCPFCEGGITSIEGKGQIWRGVKGYSDPQWYQLNHFGKLSDTDDFPRCNVEFRCRTEAEVVAAWNTRATPAAMTPEVRALSPEQLAEWRAQNPRAEAGLVAFAAWLGVTPDKVPPEFRYHTCPATKAAWDRVAAALRAGGQQ